jgi:hypothetical protein
VTSIRRWLEGLELGQYVETFEKNNIDFDIARDLGDQDLKDLGVTSMGHRKRLFRIDSVSAAPRRCERLLWRSAKVRSGRVAACRNHSTRLTAYYGQGRHPGDSKSITVCTAGSELSKVMSAKLHVVTRQFIARRIDIGST